MPQQFTPYNPKLKELARQLRNNSTKSEIRLWGHLKGRQMCGYDFHRQKPLYRYIVDFFSPKLMLAIELDGQTHHWEETMEKDVERQRYLESKGISFLRFEDDEVMNDLDNVLRVIRFWIEEFEERNPGRGLVGDSYR